MHSKISHLLMAIRRDMADSVRTGEGCRVGDIIAVQLLERLGTKHETLQEFLDILDSS